MQFEKKQKGGINIRKADVCICFMFEADEMLFLEIPTQSKNKLLETIRKEKRWLNTKLIFKIHELSTRSSMTADIFIHKLFNDAVRFHAIREKIHKTNYALSNFIKKYVRFYTCKYSS